MSTLEAPLVEFITHHWLWQGLQEDQQNLGHRVVATSYNNSQGRTLVFLFAWLIWTRFIFTHLPVFFLPVVVATRSQLLLLLLIFLLHYHDRFVTHQGPCVSRLNIQVHSLILYSVGQVSSTRIQMLSGMLVSSESMMFCSSSCRPGVWNKSSWET